MWSKIGKAFGYMALAAIFLWVVFNYFAPVLKGLFSGSTLQYGL